MDAARFDRLVLLLADRATRRRMLGFGLTGLLAAHAGSTAARKKRRKRKHKKRRRATFNAFGCVDVDGFCQNNDQCCSGICAGPKDKKSCQAHDTGGCPAGHQDTGCGGTTTLACTTSSGLNGVCERTTGNAGYCVKDDYLCADCRKDADCQAICGLLEAACIICPNCDGTPSFATACVGPGLFDCFLPGSSGLTLGT